MAWTYCKTDWTDADRMTAAHMNRIAANVNHLMDDDVAKADWIKNDFMLKSEWDVIVESLNHLATWCDMDDRTIAATCLRSADVNAAEELMEDLYDPVALRRAQSTANRYTGDGAISGGYIYAGGV